MLTRRPAWRWFVAGDVAAGLSLLEEAGAGSSFWATSIHQCTAWSAGEEVTATIALLKRQSLQGRVVVADAGCCVSQCKCLTARQVAHLLHKSWTIANSVLRVRDVGYDEDSLHGGRLRTAFPCLNLAINPIRGTGYLYIPDGSRVIHRKWMIQNLRRTLASQKFPDSGHWRDPV